MATTTAAQVAPATTAPVGAGVGTGLGTGAPAAGVAPPVRTAGGGGLATTRAGNPVSPFSDVILYFLAIFIPPLPVFFKTGFSIDVVINILLWILGWIPGVLHAWWIITRTERARVAGATTAATY